MSASSTASADTPSEPYDGCIVWVEAAERAGRDAPEVPPARRASDYGQGRENPPLRAGVLIEEQVSDTTSTGYLFSQPQVVDEASADSCA